VKTSYIWPYTLPYGDSRHGTRSAYTHHKCSCPECLAENTRYWRAYRAAKATQLAADPSLAPHGNASTYDNWGCRCVPCTAAATAAVSRRRRRAAS